MARRPPHPAHLLMCVGAVLGPQQRDDEGQPHGDEDGEQHDQHHDHLHTIEAAIALIFIKSYALTVAL